VTLAEHGIQWADVDPGSVVMGSDDRSVLFGGMGPRHEVSIDYSFRISSTPVESEEATRLVLASEAEIASESEWELAHSRGLLYAKEGTAEELADLAKDYWGKACDGRPHEGEGPSPMILRRWGPGGPAPYVSFPGQGSVTQGTRLVIRDFQGWDKDPPRLPAKRDNSSIVAEEAAISLFVGVIPSFVWAYFNASDGYIRDGWLNLVFGGVFVGVFTMVFWRPRQPTWRIKSGRMSARRGK
tara:strand:+ start:2009 stop:2731 length:723 start_codon:yes stop_codon:yes gene_type:complete